MECRTCTRVCNTNRTRYKLEMKEKEFINIIKNTLNSKYIGDDCAYLKDLGIVITQDSLVENIHFKMAYTNAYKLGYKAVMVNISDVCASGAEPKYLTISLSLPNNINNAFVKDFYLGAKEAAKNVEIVGGDITGSEKIFISVTAVGTDKNRKISSRANAKQGYKIIVSGTHGSSAAGLRLLMKGKNSPENLIEKHLMPKAQTEFSKNISEYINEDYAMMDTSDGLMDALSQIAQASDVVMSVDFDKIPYDKEIKVFDDYRDLILYGGEDYQLIAAVPENMIKNKDFYTIIGEVRKAKNSCGVEIIYPDKKEFYTLSDVENKLYKHFEE